MEFTNSTTAAQTASNETQNAAQTASVNNNMEQNNPQVAPQVETEAKNISTEQEKEARASTGASLDEEYVEFEEVTKDSIAAQHRDEIVTALQSGDEIQLREFLTEFRFANMPLTLQRGLNPTDVKKLMNSLVACKRFYRPIEVIPVLTLIEAGMSGFTKLDGTPLTADDPDITLYYVRPDGKQRSCAYAKLFSKTEYKSKENEYNVRVKLCTIPAKELSTYIREIQTAAVWDEKTNRQATVAAFGGKDSALNLMDKMMAESKMSARAAFKIINLNDGYQKGLYEESMRSGKLHTDLQADKKVIERAEHYYEALKVAFRSDTDLLKNSAAVDTLISVFTTATENQNEAVELYLTFLMSLQEADFKVVKAQNSVAEKKTKFLELFREFERHYTNSEFQKEVEQRVKKAKAEYKKAQASAPAPKVPKKTVEQTYYTI